MDSTVTKDTIPSYAPSRVDLPNGTVLAIDIVPDKTMGPPWKEHDGHGIVSEWTSRAKLPGEMVLATDGSARRYYDFAVTVRIARRDGWGAEGTTVGERAHRAAMEDFRRMQAWCNDEWQWVGVVVRLELPSKGTTAVRHMRETSLWGIESDGDYWRHVAAELANELLEEGA